LATKMLASTMQFTNNKQQTKTDPPPAPTPTTTPTNRDSDHVDRYGGSSVPSQRNNHPNRPANTGLKPIRVPAIRPPQKQRPNVPDGPFPQDPTVCSNPPSPSPQRSHSRPSEEGQAVLAGGPTQAGPNSQCSTNELPRTRHSLVNATLTNRSPQRVDQPAGAP